MDFGLGELWKGVSLWLNGDVMVILGAVGATGWITRAYFKSNAADGRLTVEDAIAIGALTIVGACVAFAFYKALS